MNIRTIALLLALCCCVRASPAITSGRAPADSDRRFDAVAGFTRTEWQNVNNVFGNATLISPDRVVLARHLINDNFRVRTSTDGAPADYTVRFRRRPDGGLGNIADLTSFYHVRVREWIFPAGRTDADDIVIGVLETPVTHIRPMVLDTRPRSGSGNAAVIASWGPEAAPDTVVPKGRLLIGDVKLRGSSGAWTTLLSVGRRGSTSGVVLNDSGAPLLIVTANGARMIGFVSTATGGPTIGRFAGTRLFPRATGR